MAIGWSPTGGSRRAASGATEWDVFTSYETAQLMLGGMVSVDESDFPTKGFKGMTLRIYNPERDQWAIYWINSAKGVLEPPVFGRFEGGRGSFAGDDMDGDRPVKVLFDWSGTDTENARAGARPSPTMAG